MKRFSKLTAVLLALVLILAMAPAAFAAAPGQTAYVSFSLNGVYGVNGEFSFGNSAIIGGTPSYSSNTTMMGSVDNNIAFFYGSAEASITITVAVPISSSAKPGDTCTVNFTYETADAAGNMSGMKTDTRTITVEAPAVVIDYSKLNAQIGAANALNEFDYTGESWTKLADALAAAQGMLSSKDQDAVNAAAKTLADAIAALEKLDYTALQTAIDSVNTFLASDAADGKLSALMGKLNEAKALLGAAKDQDDIDAAAKALTDALEELDAFLQGIVPVEPTEPTEPAPTEPVEPTEPEGDYCNIKIHYVWPVLFFISLAVNIAFAVLAFLYFRKKKEEEAAEDNGKAE